MRGPPFHAAAMLLGAAPAMAQTAMPAEPPQSPMPSRADPAPKAVPPVPADHAADTVYDPVAMAKARATLRQEHGGARYGMVLFDLAEIQPGPGGASYRWDAEAWFGGDFDRLVIKSEGEGETRGALEAAEAQVLWGHAIAPYVDLQTGIRYDLRPRPDRVYLTAGIEGLAPYWFEVEALAFVSSKGDVSLRFKAEHDLRLTQRLLLQPRVETNVAFQRTPELGLGAGINDVELGLRLRYEVTHEFAPYVGVTHDARLGRTADMARAAGEDVRRTRLVLGVRTWF